MKQLLALLIVVAVTESVCSRQNIIKLLKKRDIDTAYIESYSDKIITGLYFPQKFVKFGATDQTSGKSVVYMPNVGFSAGISASYKWLGISIARSFRDREIDKNRRGKTQSLDLQYNFNMRRFIIDGYFQKYKGFYFSNMEDYFNFWSYENDYPKTSLSISNIGFVINYLVNYDKFSLSAAFNFDEKQKNNAGSIIIGLFSFINILHADSTFIPGFASQYFTEISQLKSMRTTNTGMTIGYAYTFVVKNILNVSMGLIPGIGLYDNRAANENGTPINYGTRAAIFLQTRISMVYQKKGFFVGFSGILGTQSSLNKDRYSFTFGHGQTKLSIGYRFEISKKLREKIGFIN